MRGNRFITFLARYCYLGWVSQRETDVADNAAQQKTEDVSGRADSELCLGISGVTCQRIAQLEQTNEDKNNQKYAVNRCGRGIHDEPLTPGQRVIFAVHAVDHPLDQSQSHYNQH